VHILAAVWAGSSLAGEREPTGASKVWCSLALVDASGSIPQGSWTADNQIPEAEAYAVSVASDGEQKLYVA
jgi:hypothetical protein